MDPTASLVLAEVVTPGWSPDGRPFRYDELRLRTEIRVESGGKSGLLALDNLLIRPPPHDVTGMGFMEGFSHVGSLIAVDGRVDQALADDLHALADGHDAYTGVSLTATVDGISGLVLRSLSNSTEELNRLLGACSALLRQRWHGTAPTGPQEILMTTLAGFAALYRQREQLPLRTRLLATFGAVAALHAAAVVLLLAGLVTAGEPLALGLVLTAYLGGHQTQLRLGPPRRH